MIHITPARAVHNAMRTKRPDALPMVGRLTCESKKRDEYGLHRYVLTLKFAKSRRHYGDEIIHAATRKAALKLARRMFPSAKVR